MNLLNHSSRRSHGERNANGTLVWNSRLNAWDWPVEEETPEELAAIEEDYKRRKNEQEAYRREQEAEWIRRRAQEAAWEADHRKKAEAAQKEADRLKDMERATAEARLEAAELDLEIKRAVLAKHSPPIPASAEAVEADLAPRAFDMANPPPRPVPLLSLGDHVICTPGNISNVQASAKAGKSAAIGAIMAAIFDGRRQGSDTLGFLAENPNGKALVHFDTEQSRFDHHALVVKSLIRARLETPPGWFMSFSVADMSIPARVAALEATIQRAAADHGGVFAVIVDGIADLVFDPNDSAECFALVGQLHALAIKHDCAIITVLHENPGAVEGKTRGHLGSQLERKAETNLRLTKDSNGITTIFTERARHAHIPRDAGSCFQWSDTAEMHVSCGTAKEIKADAKATKAREEAAKVFASGESFTFSELRDAIMERLVMAERTAKLRIQNWQTEGVIVKGRDTKFTLV